MILGVYQLMQTKAYTQEHPSSNGQYEIRVHKHESGILKAQIQSRHVSNRKQNLSLEYDQKLALIRGWYYQCIIGSRTVGRCANTASVLWYLGYERHHPGKPTSQPSSKFMENVCDAAANVDDLGDDR